MHLIEGLEWQATVLSRRYLTIDSTWHHWTMARSWGPSTLLGAFFLWTLSESESGFEKLAHLSYYEITKTWVIRSFYINVKHNSKAALALHGAGLWRLRRCSRWVLRMPRHLHCIQLIIPIIPRRRPCLTMWTWKMCKRLKISREFPLVSRSRAPPTTIDELIQVAHPGTGWFCSFDALYQAKRVHPWPMWPLILLQQHSWCICSSIWGGGVPRFQGIFPIPCQCSFRVQVYVGRKSTIAHPHTSGNLWAAHYSIFPRWLTWIDLMMKWAPMTKKENQF